MKNELKYLLSPVSTGLYQLVVNPSKSSLTMQLVDKGLIDHKDSLFFQRHFNELQSTLSIFDALAYEVKDSQIKGGFAYSFLRDSIDIVEFKKEYKDALVLYAATFNRRSEPSGSSRQSSRDGFDFIETKKGIVLTRLVYSQKHLPEVLYSTSSEPLKEIGNFLKSVGLIESWDLMTIFSPENELLMPYVFLLNRELGSVNLPAMLENHFKRSTSEFNNKNYIGSVSAAALVVEECLGQIYETINRDSVPKRRSMGQLHNLIVDSVIKITASKQPKALDAKTTLDKISKVDPKQWNSGSTLKVANHLIQYFEHEVDEATKEILSKLLNDEDSKDKDCQIFPKKISVNLMELRDLRNAASHRSASTIDEYVAERFIQMTFAFAYWWNQARMHLNGDDDKKTSIKILEVYSAKYPF